MSGFSSLTFELVWSRMLLRIFGTTVYASSAVLGAFMAGFAVGSFIAGRYSSKKMAQNSFLYYGYLELFVAVCGILPFIVGTGFNEPIASFLENASLGNDELSYFLRLLSSTITLLLPCAAMGATYPLLSRFLRTLGNKPTFAFLYSANCFGAMAGSLSCGFLFLPLLGIRNTSLIGSALCLTVFAAVLATNGWLKEGLLKTAPPKSNPANDWSSATLLTPNQAAFLSFFAGFCAMVLELIFIRYFSTLFGSCLYSMSIVLAVVLASMALGATAVRAGRLSAQQLSIFSFALTALFLLVPLFLAPFSWSVYNTTDSFLSATKLCADSFMRALLTRCFVAIVYLLPPMFFACAALPSIASSAEKGSRDSTKSIAAIYAANCTGAICGATAGGFILIPFFMNLATSGMESALKVVFSISAASAAYLAASLPAAKSRGIRKILFGVLSVASVAIWLLPSVWLSPQTLKSRDIVFYKEGLNSTVTLTESSQLNLVTLQNDGKTEATLPYDLRRLCPGSDFSTHVLLAELPVLLHSGPVKKALQIGLGTGTTAAAFSRNPELTDLTVDELEPAVVEACLNCHQLGYDSKFKLRINDARYLLLSQKDSYDIIASQPADPWISGSADLYTKEFWALTKKRLNNNGIFCQWLQLYAIPPHLLKSLIGTFQNIYPRTVVCHAPGAGEIILLGFKNEGRFSSSVLKEKIESAYRFNAKKGYAPFLERIGVSRPEDLLAFLIAAPLPSKQGLIKENTDDYPYAEFVTGKAILSGTSNLRENLQMILEEPEITLEALDRDWSDNESGARQLARLARARASNIGSSNDRISKRIVDLAARAVHKHPCPETYWYKALVETQSGNKNAADLDTKNALNSPAKTDTDYVCLLDINLVAGNFLAAESLYENAIAKYPSCGPLIERGAWLALAGNKPQIAWQRFNLAAANTHPSVLSRLGIFYAGRRLDKKQQAEDALVRYLMCNPWNGNAHLLYSLLLAEKQQFKEAWAHALDCNLLNPHDCRGFCLVLDASIKAGQVEQAGTFLKTLPSRLTDTPELSQAAALLQKPDIADRQKVENQYSSLIKQIKDDTENPKFGYNLFGFP